MKFQRVKNPSSGGRLRPLGGFSRPRGGLTLIEILMTIFVLAIGLLGVAALLPVGTFQMRQGQIAQRSAEIGGGALDTIEASGINHPSRWLAYSEDDSTYFPFDAVVDKNATNPNAPEYVRIACPVDTTGTFDVDTPDADGDGKNDLGLTEQEDFYSNCLVEFVRCQWPRASGGTEDVWGKQWWITDGTVIPGGTTTFGTPSSPSSQGNDVFVIKRYEPFAIDPLYVARHVANTPTVAVPPFVPNPDNDWPINMPRLTLSNGLGASMGQPAAEAIFQAADDLLFTPGTDAGGIEDESKLPEPPWPPKVTAEGKVSPRPSLGNYSWLATFVPVEQSGGYQDGRTYTVSVAVFYKRPLQLPLNKTERPLTLAHGSGSTFTISGATFENQDATENPPTFDPDDGDESYIKSGLWGLVTVVAQDASTGREWVERARWYRLGSVGKPADTTGNPVKARLIGPDWAFNDRLTNDPSQPKANWNPPPDGIDDDDPNITYTYQITFYEGVVAVFERTMRVPDLPLGEAAP